MNTNMNNKSSYNQDKINRVLDIISLFIQQAREHYYSRYQNKYLNDDYINMLVDIEENFNILKNELNDIDNIELNQIEIKHSLVMKKIGMSVG